MQIKIIFSEHAKNQLKERNIAEIRVIEAITFPDKIVKQVNQRMQAVKIYTIQSKKYLLIVVFEQTNTVKTIITAFITSKIRKYL
ncbi:DUF4258 domain-containing protein [bacterium]|nr:MAG: DUF4258 domain-containing protein [bacterium]